MLVIGFVFAVLCATIYLGISVHARDKYGVSAKKVKRLSEVSQKILAEYNKLPRANRPGGDFYKMLRSLDTKYADLTFGVDNPTNELLAHFSERGYEGYRVIRRSTLEGCDRGSRCKFKTYHDLYRNIQSISEALEEQRRSLRLAAVQDDLSYIEEYTDRLRQEAQIIQTVTKELS